MCFRIKRVVLLWSEERERTHGMSSHHILHMRCAQAPRFLIHIYIYIYSYYDTHTCCSGMFWQCRGRFVLELELGGLIFHYLQGYRICIWWKCSGQAEVAFALLRFVLVLHTLGTPLRHQTRQGKMVRMRRSMWSKLVWLSVTRCQRQRLRKSCGLPLPHQRQAGQTIVLLYHLKGHKASPWGSSIPKLQPSSLMRQAWCIHTANRFHKSRTDLSLLSFMPRHRL